MKKKKFRECTQKTALPYLYERKKAARRDLPQKRHRNAHFIILRFVAEQ